MAERQNYSTQALPSVEEKFVELVKKMADGSAPLPQAHEIRYEQSRRSVVGEPNAVAWIHGRPESAVVRVIVVVSLVEEKADSALMTESSI